MKDSRDATGAPRGGLIASGPTRGPHWASLRKCLLIGVPATLLMAILAWIFTDGPGVLSVLFAALLVQIFFGLSLLVAHLVSLRLPDAVMGTFLLTFFVKIVGFAAVLFTLGTPDWLNRPWFAGAAVVSVLLWQFAEIWAFTQRRLLVFNDVATVHTTAPTSPKDTFDGQE